jgi:hypothetical protein
VPTQAGSYCSKEEKEVRRGSISMKRRVGWCSPKTGTMAVLQPKSGEGSRALALRARQMEAVAKEEGGNMLLG